MKRQNKCPVKISLVLRPIAAIICVIAVVCFGFWGYTNNKEEIAAHNKEVQEYHEQQEAARRLEELRKEWRRSPAYQDSLGRKVEPSNKKREEQKQEEQKQRTENHSSVPSSTGNSYHYGTTHQQETQTYHETLRDWYDSPEDLYEDGGYDDLDEAYDEWEDDD